MLKEETVDRALRELEKGYAQYQYFFDHLTSPAWLEHLSRRGFFQKPPDPIHEGQYVSIPLWPESKYLVRMARIPEAQEAVLEIAVHIPATENSRVLDDLADIALALQPALSSKLVPQACEWVKSPMKLLLPEKIGNLIVHLAEGGQGPAALILARAALSLSADPKGAQTKDEDSWVTLEPQPRFRDFYYSRIVNKAVPALAKAMGFQAVQMFCDLLNDAIGFTMKTPHEGDEDYLYIRHPAIEDSVRHNDIPSLLLCAIRDTAERLITDNSTKFTEVLQLLRAYKWTSFRRLELHFIRIFANQGLPIAELIFQDPELLDESGLRHEAVLLLQSSFSLLNPTTQHKILAWIDRGRPEASTRRWLEFIKEEATEETIKKLSDIWQRDRYAILQGQLPESYQHKLDGLIAATGAVRRLEKPDRPTGGAVGPISPKSVEDLGRMTVDEVITFFSSWSPGTGIFEPTAEGLGRNFTAVVVQRPGEFAVAAGSFKTVDPTYVRCFFEGLTVALKQGLNFAWRPVLDLAVWIVSQPREIPDRRGGLMDKDPDWGWTRNSLIELITAGMQDNPGKLAFENRPRVWDALKLLNEDPQPSLEDETHEHFEPAESSLNSTRGRAFRAVMQYALWVRQCTDFGSEGQDWRSQTFSAMPEVREILDANLQLESEPTLTIRSVYGQFLPTLATLDWEWLQDRLPRILPPAPENVSLFRAAWESFISFCEPHSALLSVLMPAYTIAVSQIGKVKCMMRHPADPEIRLAEHLMVYYWLGNVSFDSDDHLLEHFYRTAPDGIRGHAMWFVGRSVAQWDENVPHEVLTRLRNLMEIRLAAAQATSSAGDYQSELANFGWWFISGKFDQQWAIGILLAALQLTKRVDAEMDVAERLADLCRSYPLECVSCLRLMIEGDRDRWLLAGIQNAAEKVLRVALGSNNPEAATSAGRLTEELIARGHFEFRRILL
jgi:hypothetical protein